MEQYTNKYVTEEIPFTFSSHEKVLMAYSCRSLPLLPCGFGTLDELFEILTLVQTGKISKVLII
ncbi:MAG: LOG family protein [Candidatus Paceibacterota bacterium]